MRKEGVLLIFIAVLLPLVSASFSVNNYSVETVYGPGETIRGEIEVNISSEPGDSELTGSSGFDGSIQLIDFLDANSAEFACIPDDCNDNYATTGTGSESKSFSLGFGEEKILGLKLTGEIESVTGLSFSLSVDNPVSCLNPLEIDILNDGAVEWKSNELVNIFNCGENRGCFEETGSQEVRIGNNIYCEKINLIKNRKFELGAWVRGNETASPYLLEMWLYDLYGGEIDHCTLDNPNINGGELSCEIELNEEIEGEHYVCLKSDEDTYYRIKRENNEPCGFYGTVPSAYSFDYYIFARAAGFKNIGTFTFDQAEYEEQGNYGDLDAYIDDYLANYDYNCNPECVIPIKFKAKEDLSISISDIVLSYEKEGSPQDPGRKIYDAEKEAAKVSFGGILNLGFSNIKTPEEYGEHNLMLYLDGEEVLDDEIEIEIEKVPVIKNIFPKIVSAAVPTKFTAVVDSPSGQNISVYRWYFGDENITTTENKVEYTYDSTGIYTLSLEVEDAAGFIGKKDFEILVKNPKELVNSTIAKYKKRIDDITSQIDSLPLLYKEKVEEIIDVDFLNSEIKRLEREYGSALEEDYVDIMTELVDLEVPYLIEDGTRIETPFFIDATQIEPSYFYEFGAGDYSAGEKQEFQKAIAGWVEDELDMTLNFKYILAYYDWGIEILVSAFDLSINADKQVKELYIIIENPDVSFKGSEKTKEFDDALGIKLENVLNKKIEFAVPEMDIDDLVLYLSPVFSDLVIEKIEPCDFDGLCEPGEGEDWHNCRSDCKPWGIVLILLIILILVALVSYIMLQWWYKRKYEGHLFKNKNDLFNIVNFIKNARNQGMSDSEIKKALKQAGWKGEQIVYAFKKMGGRSIMPFDFLKLFKKIERDKLKGILPQGKSLPNGNQSIRKTI